ncbi:nucleoside hydrolase [Sphingoaurantiacus capsulatus]|uniref:Nucleoside hydrolase n=1 Tax=Sphingoaurantiacus capsulatus TaxID=1771310 RepID=A0ABV7X8N2_9SPHN
MTATPIIFDCDPGVDDAVALLLAFASPELELLAITTTAGNVSGTLTARNARLIRQLAGREDVPVHIGAERPLVREPVEAGAFHGESGLGALPIAEPALPVTSGDAVQAIIDIVRARPEGSVTLVVTGPMTNAALALQRAPDLAARLKAIVAMGGARSEGGNITASAEFNIFADPHAADVVCRSGVTIVAFGLDATHQVRATEARIAAIEALGNPLADAAASLLRFSREVERQVVHGLDAPLHDPCPIAWLIRPSLFELRPCRLDVETGSPLTMGHTAVEFRAPEPNAQWAVKADADGLFALLTERLA